MKEFGLFNVAYLPNCIEHEASPNLESLPKPENFTILYLSNFLIKKGILDLLEAIKIVNARQSIPINFKLVGNYSNEISKEKLDQLVAKLQYVSVGTPVFGSEKYSLIEQVDALILPSYIEGLPLTLLESLSRAKPILISPVGFIPEVLGHEYPFYIQPGNVQSIVTGITSLVENYSTNLKLDMYKRYQKFSLENHRNTLLSIFAE
jgi:glycosyltransferase involved in cell wall biosynthesis